MIKYLAQTRHLSWRKVDPKSPPCFLFFSSLQDHLLPSVLLPDTDFFLGTVSLPSLELPRRARPPDDSFPYDPAAPTLLTMLDMCCPQRHHSPALSRATAVQGLRSGSPRPRSR